MRARAEPFGAVEEPNPDVRVEQKFQSRRASTSSRSITGETMSPRILMEFRMDPNRAARSTTRAAGTTSATGLPWRVMRMGCFVFSTRSRSARHFALNTEMATSCMGVHPDHIIDHGQNNSQILENVHCTEAGEK